jgi:hypothetical protein
MNDLPEDLAKPRQDHADLATYVTGAFLLLILGALVVWVVTL